MLGVNIGKSRVVPIEEANEDYLASFETVWPHADYVAVNVSSPNTPGLRELQRADLLASLLGALQTRNRELATREGRGALPLLVKVAPDLGAGELELIVEAARRAEIAGLIATNTTTARAGLRTRRGARRGVRRRRTERRAASRALDARGRRAQASDARRAGDSRRRRRLQRGRRVGENLRGRRAGAALHGLRLRGRSASRGASTRDWQRSLERHGFRTLDEAVGCRAEEFAAP